MAMTYTRIQYGVTGKNDGSEWGHLYIPIDPGKYTIQWWDGHMAYVDHFFVKEAIKKTMESRTYRASLFERLWMRLVGVTFTIDGGVTGTSYAKVRVRLSKRFFAYVADVTKHTPSVQEEVK